jgi:hypothetical protein
MRSSKGITSGSNDWISSANKQLPRRRKIPQILQESAKHRRGGMMLRKMERRGGGDNDQSQKLELQMRSNFLV